LGSRGGSRKIVWGGQKRIFAPPNLPFPYTYHVKGGQFGGGKNMFLPRKINFLPRLPPLDPPVLGSPPRLCDTASSSSSTLTSEALRQWQSVATDKHFTLSAPSEEIRHGPVPACYFGMPQQVTGSIDDVLVPCYTIVVSI